MVSETIKREWPDEIGPGKGDEEGLQQVVGSRPQRTARPGQASWHPGVKGGILVPGQEEGEGLKYSNRIEVSRKFEA